MWGKTKTTQTFGQTFEELRRTRESLRASAMKTVVPYFVEDIKKLVLWTSEKFPTQKLFVFHTADILRGVYADAALVSPGYYKLACGKSDLTPTIDELALFSDAALTAAIFQDYEVCVQQNGNLISVDFSNTEKLTTERLALEKLAAEEKAKIASALDKIASK